MSVVDYADVPRLLLDEVPEFGPSYAEHVSDSELLPHVLFGELSRFVVAAYMRSDSELAVRVVNRMERLLEAGDHSTRELVAVSFVENIGPDDVDDAFFGLYGQRLREHLRRIWGVVPTRDAC